MSFLNGGSASCGWPFSTCHPTPAASTGDAHVAPLRVREFSMDERVSFITHRGHENLLGDFSGCSAKEILLLLDEIQRTVAQHPRNSLLTLGDFTGAQIDRAVVTRMKEVLVLDR